MKNKEKKMKTRFFPILVGKPYGFITLVTYFLGLAATWHSYTHVGY
jgi:hypothetical protein